MSLVGLAAGTIVYLRTGGRSAASTNLGVIAWLSLVYGCGQHARAKGHSGWWGPLVGFIGLIGLIPLLTLPDLRPDGKHPRPEPDPDADQVKRAA